MPNYSLEEMARQTNTGKRNTPSLDEMAERAGISNQPADEGFLSNLWKGAKTGVAGTYGGLAGWVGGENAATKYFDDVVNSNRRSHEYDGYSADYFTNGSGLAYDLGQLIGSIGSMAPAAFIPGVGAAGTAAARFVPGLLGRGLVRSAASKVGAEAALSSAEKWAASKAGQNFLANAARYGAGSGGVESLSEGGSGVTEGFKNGDENPYLTGLEITAKNLPLLIASNTLEAATLGRGMMRFGGKAGESLAKRAALAVPRATPYAGVQALQQSGEEVAQQRIQEEAFNRPTGGILPSTWTPEEMKAFQDTFAAGGVMGLIGGLPGGFRRASNSPMQNPELDAAQEIINQSQQVQSVQAQPIDSEPTAQPAMSVQEAQSRMSQPAPTISAENSLDGFDNRYVSKWESQPGATDLANVQPSVKNRFNAMMAEYGDSVILTGGAETGGYHQGGGYGHEGGWKLDVDINSVKDKEKFLALCKKYGFAVGDESDKGHYDLSGHRNGGVGGKQIVTPDSFISDGGQAASATDADMSRFNSKQREAWNEAQWVEQQTGIPAEYIYRQWAHESANFTSRLATENNNFGGLTQTTPNGEENKQPDGGNYYRMYNNMHEYAESYVKDFINRYDGKENVKSMEDFVNFLHSNGYFTADPSEYLASMQGVDAPTSRTGYKGSNIDIDIPETKTDTSKDNAFAEYNKQLDELAQNGIEAPFKAEQPTQKELVQQAKEAAIDAGDMDEVQRINSAERSGNTEELAKIADKALKAKQKEAKGKTAPATPEIKMATPNLIKQVKDLAASGKQQGAPINEALVSNALERGQESELQDLVGILQGVINTHGFEDRKAKGKELLDYADNNGIDLAPSLRAGLVKGYPKAIEAGQAVVNKANAQTQPNTPVSQQTVSKQEQVQPQPAQTPVQAQPAQNEQLTLQDRVNQVRGNEPGTPVNGVKVSELASIINGAGSQQQAPAQETKQAEPIVEAFKQKANDIVYQYRNNKINSAIQANNKIRKLRASMQQGQDANTRLALSEAQDSIIFGELREVSQGKSKHGKDYGVTETPASETTPVDEDYHGFFDDKKTGAVREAKKRLEEKINPFGDGEGFRTVKSIVERWAEADESNQSNTKGRSYYVHGNKVSKAAYDYYNHMFKNSEKEVQAESAPKQESAKEQAAPAASTEGKYPELTKSEREHWENIAKNASPAMMKMYGESAVERAEKEGVKIDENLANDAKAGNPAAIAYVSQLAWEHSMKNFDKLPKVEPKSKEVDPAKAYENLKQLYKDITHKKQLGSDWGSYALRKAVEQGYTLSEDEKAVVSPDGKRYELSGKAIEEFRLRQRDAEDNERANVDKSGDKSANDERKDLIDRVMQGYHDGKKSLDDAKVELKHYRDRFANMARGKVTPTEGRSLNEIVKYADQQLKELESASKEKIDNELSQQDNGGKIEVETKESPKQEKPLPSSYAERKAELKKDFEDVAQNRDMAGTVEVVRKYLNRVVVAMKADMDGLVNNPDISLDLDTYLAGFTDVRNMIEDIMTPGALSAFDGDQKREIRGRVRDAVEAARAELKAHKNSLSKQEKPAEKENNGRIFKDTKTADEEMLEGLGLNDEAFDDIDVKGVTNIDDEIDNLTKELTRELSKLNANPVFNPRVYTVGLKLAILLTKKGYNNVKKLVAELNARFGKDIEPWSESIIETVRTWPKGVPFDERQVMVVSQAIGARYEDGITSLDDVQADMKKKLKKHHARFAPMIEASYNGISKFFESRKEGVSNETDSGRTGDESKRSEGTETVPAGTERGTESVSERERGSEGTDRGLETSPAENGQEVSENGNPEGVRAGVSGETGRQSNAPQGRADGHVGRESGSESESSPMGRGGRQSSREGSSGSSRVGGVREETSSPLTNAENYHIDDMNALFGGTPKVRFARNRKAIEVFQDLQATKRVPTQEEKDAMAAYTGWGSFGQQLFQGTYENPKPAKGWEEESEWLRDTLGKEDWESAKDSIINAHYTAPVIVKAMWDMARRMGFKNGRVLEPSMGVGNFFGLMPKDMEQGSSLFGVEMDNTTGGMAKMLYPQANIQIKPYQDVHVADGTYDLIVGNVPFGDIAPADRRYDKFRPNLHDYFFLKGIDELRSGGIMMAITSKGTMDKMNRGVRMELAKKAELVDAYRFPTGAFGEYAGTDVVTDVLIFKKREEPIMDVSGEDWIGTTEHKSDQYDYNNHEYYTYRVNNFFENHPEKVLGTMGFGRATGKRPGLMVTMNPETFQKQLDDMVKHVTKDAYEEAHYDKNLQYVSNNENDRIGTLQEVDGKLYVATGVDSKPIEAFKEWSLGGNITSTKTINERLEELKDLVKLRKAYAKLEDAEKNDSPDMEKLRKQLKSVYDAHVAKYCTDKNGKPQTVTYTDYDENGNKVKKKRPKLLEDTAGLKLFKKADEPNYFSLCALQRKDGKPAKILTERVMRTSKKDIENPTLQEALMIQRNQSMRIDIDEIAKMAKKSKEEVISGLREYLFKTPNGDYQVKDQYLSGNVRRKLREAQNAYANGDKDMKHNIEALQKVMPEDIPYYNISVSFGGTWIDLPYYKQFIAELVGTNNTDKIDITRDKSGSWRVRFEDSSLNGTAGATTTYGTPDVKFDRLLTHALNHTKPTINRTDPDGTKYKDEAAIEKAVEQMDKIRETFADWVWQEEKRKVALAHNYNEIMNNTARPTYDGSFLDMAGMMLTKGDKEFNLRKHQINAIYRGLVNGSGIYAHEVGTGKTYTMGGLAMESRRFGVAKKPLILAHNANSQTVANDIQAMYPGAKVLYIAGDTKNVKKDLMRVKMDDWDVIVMPHSKTNLLTLKTETLDAMAADIIAELEDDAMEAAKADGVDLSKYDLDDEKDIKKIRSQTAKDLVKQRLRIKEQIRKYAFKASDKEAIPFEDLGIDMIIVDESHDYKKPPFSTKMSVKGLQKGVSGASVQLSFLTQYVQGLNNGKGVHLFTGTPITNTITEMYHNMRYVMPNEMKEAGVYNFDDWFNAFANVTSNMEYTSTGEVDNVDRLNAFVNVAELRRMVGQYMDIVFAEDMPEFKPRETASGKTLADKDLTAEERDYLINGRDENAVGRPYMQTINEVIPMNDAQKSILSMFMGYAKDWKKANKKQRKHIMLESLPQSPLYTESSTHKAAMDARMFNPNINVSGMDSKEARVIKNVVDVYKKDKRATQVIMMDQGKSDSSVQIPRDDRGYPIAKKDAEGRTIKEEVQTYNLQKGIIDGLIKQGIPEKEIAVVTGTTSPDKKAEIANAVKHGEIRVVIGSTATLGTGVNMQDNLKAIHHIDAPWMPGDLEQRNGRILRQGNKWNTVLEYRYITEKLDGRRWQVLSTKKKFIKMFMKADDDLRVLDGDAVDVSSEEEASGGDFEETLSKATGDPRFLRKANLEETVKKLEKSRAAFVAGIEDAKFRLQKLKEGGLDELRDNVRALTAIQDKYGKYKQTHADSFEITIDGKRYTKTTDANEAIAAAFRNSDKIGKEFKLGEYAGLNLYGIKQRNTDFTASYTNRIRITDSDKTIPGFDCADSTGGINQKLANVGRAIDREQNKLDMAESDIKTLEKQIKGTFPREAVLNAKQKELEALKQDLIDNPVPPPQWLVEGAPMQADVIVDGKRGTVESYRVVGETTFEQNEDGEVQQMTATDEEHSSFYVGVKLDGSDTVRLYPWQKVMDNQGLPMITAPEGVSESEELKDNEVRPAETKETKAEEPVKEEKTEAPKEEAKKDFIKDHIFVGTVPPAGKSTANVNVDEFEHTKTGKMIPAASLKDHVDKDFRKQATTIAKNHGGKWSPFAKRILFKTEQGRDDFVREVEALLSVTNPESSGAIDVKFSIDGWHGSRQHFDKFSITHIGEGEGAQAHGHGLYIAGNRSVAEGYRKRLAGTIEMPTFEEIKVDGVSLQDMLESAIDNGEYEKQAMLENYERYDRQGVLQSAQEEGFDQEYIDWFTKIADEVETQIPEQPGALYQVEIPDSDVLLDEQKEFSEQPKKVQDALRQIAKDIEKRGLTEVDDRLDDFVAYLDTYTGKKIYRMLTHMWDESPQDASKYLNKYGIKGITYEGGRDGRCFVIFDDQAIEIINKFSAEGEIRRAVEQAKPVANEDLTPQQRKMSEFGKEMGTPIMWISTDPKLHGFHAPNGTTVLNVRSNMDLSKTFWHEAFHWVAGNNEALYNELLDYFKGKSAFSPKQLEAYRKRIGRPGISDELAIEEMLADTFEEVKDRVKIFKEMGAEQPSLARKFVAWVKRIMDKFAEFFHNPEGKLTTAQRDSFVKAFGRLARDMKDGNGRPLFKVYNDGKEIRLPSGELATASIKLSAGKANNETQKHSKPSAFFDGASMSFVSADVAYNEALYRYQNAKSDSEKEKAYAELKRLVEQAAKEAGFENAIPEQTVAYKTRTKAAPKKSIKVYKVFTVSNDGSPTALFIGGTEKLPQGVWLDAQDAYHFKAANGKYYVPSTQNPYTKGGKTGVSVEIPNDKVRQELIKRGFLKPGSTAAKVTALAYRPGWHAGTMPFFPQGGMKPPKGMNSAYPNIHRYNQVVFECELAADKDYTQEAENQPKARKKDGSLDTRNADLQYMPENGYYYYATNPLTHGHPELGMWAISGSLKINRALSQEECDKILADHNMAPQEWEQGEMKLEDLGYTGQQYDAARKTLAPITYDDNGKVIPLSERFNAEVDDIRFSYGPSDNSSEGLWHRIKNIMAGKGNEDSEKFRYRKHLTEMIEKALDVKLRYGKMEGNKSKVVYKPDDRVLRSRHAFDWENILPVAGRIAAEQLEIEPTESMNNYIADWILTGAPNNVSKEADTFHKAMREHPAYSAKLEDLHDAFAEWLGKDYREQMQGTIQWKNNKKVGAWRLWRKDTREALYEELVEELEPINRMVKQVNANLTEKGQKKLGISADPMVAFRMLRGSYGRAMAALEGVNDGAVDALKHAFPNVDFNGFKTLYQILKSIDAFQNADKQRDFVTYCTACHIMDMHQHNDDIRQEQQHLKNKIEKLGTSKEDEKQKAEYEKDIEKLSNELMPIPATYSKDNCQKYINDGYDKYHAAQQDLVHFSNTTAAMLADSGVISEKRFQELLTKWQNYVPLFRVFEDNEDINFGDSMKHIKGSTRDIVNPLESIIRNTAQFIQKAELNKAKCLLADVARCDASGWLLEEVDKSDSDKTTITFWENGKRKYLQTDPDIVRAVNNMGVDSSHLFMKFLHAITRLARACFTMASPEFALRNVARDWQDATLYTKHGMWVNPLDIIRGFIHAWKKDDVFYEWLTQGAAQASALSLDRDYTQSTLDKLGRGYWKRLTSRDWYNALLEGLQMAGEYSEYGTRIAMYKKTKAAILKDKPNATKEELHEAMLEAAFESRDLMDFARHGKAGAEYNKITAFANASIQGWDKLYRSLDFRNDPKRATRTAAKLVLYGALPAMMIFAMYHDDDWYKDAPNWLKETHWLFKFGDTTIRIPKAADMGIRFISNAVEKGLDEAYNKHPHKTKEYFLPMWDALPGMLPTSILPIIEIQANHAFFTDRPIIPQGQDKLPAKLQYGPYTTSLAKWIGETFDIAPRSVEHFISGYTGTLGMAIPKAIDLVSGANQQSLSLEEMPLIRGYLYPQFKSPQSVSDYYEKLNEQTKLKNEYKLTHKRPDGFDPALLQRLENAQKQLRKISKQEKSIIDNPKWSIHDKEVMQRNIQKKRIEIAKRALGTK